MSAVLESFGNFSQTYREAAERVLHRRHLDTRNVAAKPMEAWCQAVTPDLVPWVQMKFGGTLANVVTLAHELGHAVSHHYAREQSVLNYEPANVIGETAAAFSELLLFDHLISASNGEHRLTLETFQLRELLQSVLQSISDLKFEIEAHRMILSGGRLGDLADLNLSLLKRLYEPTLMIGQEMEHHWFVHTNLFESPFRNVGYPLANLVALRLFDAYRRDPGEARAAIEAIYSAGSSRPMADLLAEAGIELEQNDWIEDGFRELALLVDRAEKSIPVADLGSTD